MSSLLQLKFRRATDEFCPFCHCQRKNKTHSLDMERWAEFCVKREGNVGQLPIKISKCAYCLLHAKLRITELLLRVHAQSIYEQKGKKRRKVVEELVRPSASYVCVVVEYDFSVCCVCVCDEG